MTLIFTIEIRKKHGPPAVYPFLEWEKYSITVDGDDAEAMLAIAEKGCEKYCPSCEYDHGTLTVLEPGNEKRETFSLEG